MLLLLLLSCGLIFGQTKTVIGSGSAVPAATDTKSGDIGGGLYVVDKYDAGRYLNKTALWPAQRTLLRWVIADYKYKPAALFTKSGDVGGGLYVVDEFAAGQYLYKTVVFIGSLSGPPFDPPSPGVVNNPVKFR